MENNNIKYNIIKKFYVISIKKKETIYIYKMGTFFKVLLNEFQLDIIKDKLNLNITCINLKKLITKNIFDDNSELIIDNIDRYIILKFKNSLNIVITLKLETEKEIDHSDKDNFIEIINLILKENSSIFQIKTSEKKEYLIKKGIKKKKRNILNPKR